MAKKKDRNEKGKFIEGNKAAEKWTEKTVSETLLKIWQTLTDGHEDANGNFVRANDIKTLAEVCLMNDVSKQRWSEWKEKFKDSEAVSELIKKVEWVVETRLIYSGGAMDIFVLTNHYEYKNSFKGELSGKNGEPLYPKDEIDYSKLSDTVLDALIAAKKNDSNS